MAIAKVDSKKRILLPKGRPGDVYEILQEGEGRLVLVRLEKPKAPGRMTKKACLEAIKKAPLTPTMSWEELRELTREP